MDSNQGRSVLVGVVAFLVGWAVGLFIFGWWLWPVQYEGAGPQDLREADQQIYLQGMADLYAFDGNQARVQDALGGWEDADVAICTLAVEETDPAQSSRYVALAAVLNGEGCTNVTVGEAAEEAGGGRTIGSILLVCGLLIVLALLVAAIILVFRRRGGTAPSEPAVDYGPPPDQASVPMAPEAEQQVTPIARFQTTYVRGHDTYDDSFSIENAEGDFLGECGVGLSETIGAETPKNVTAFEVWLFDKNDIRTVTKVVMSDHAFFDEAIKAKLAPKGEPVLARPNETIVLETASLIVNAEITEMEYGTGTLPPQSFFERFTVELSAWAKEGDFGEPDVQGRIDEMLDF